MWPIYTGGKDPMLHIETVRVPTMDGEKHEESDGALYDQHTMRDDSNGVWISC
jgi:hypothetical protein